MIVENGAPVAVTVFKGTLGWWHRLPDTHTAVTEVTGRVLATLKLVPVAWGLKMTPALQKPYF